MIHQHKYVKELLKRLKMEDTKESGTLIATATKLDIYEPGSYFDQKLYRGIIGSLLYLTASRSDIIFSVGLCNDSVGRFESYNSVFPIPTSFWAKKESHLTVVKRILRYLKGTTDLCIWYPNGSNVNLVGYVDVDYAGFLVDRKSTSGIGHFLGSCLVSWANKKQNHIALSIIKAEYVVAALVVLNCCGSIPTNGLWN
ncbi:secreted RxLR effector protein 161-like [Nicotiana tomentosiformis]|uniref:secreted RxLR effector protein 161-like n=1 Tax=Nicotiana tomentosiformis TaxID=4098 RepID=UPI00388CBAA0